MSAWRFLPLRNCNELGILKGPCGKPFVAQFFDRRGVQHHLQRHLSGRKSA